MAASIVSYHRQCWKIATATASYANHTLDKTHIMGACGQRHGNQ